MPHRLQFVTGASYYGIMVTFNVINKKKYVPGSELMKTEDLKKLHETHVLQIGSICDNEELSLLAEILFPDLYKEYVSRLQCWERKFKEWEANIVTIAEKVAEDQQRSEFKSLYNQSYCAHHYYFRWFFRKPIHSFIRWKVLYHHLKNLSADHIETINFLKGLSNWNANEVTTPNEPEKTLIEEKFEKIIDEFQTNMSTYKKNQSQIPKENSNNFVAKNNANSKQNSNSNECYDDNMADTEEEIQNQEDHANSHIKHDEDENLLTAKPQGIDQIMLDLFTQWHRLYVDLSQQYVNKYTHEISNEKAKLIRKGIEKIENTKKEEENKLCRWLKSQIQENLYKLDTQISNKEKLKCTILQIKKKKTVSIF